MSLPLLKDPIFLSLLTILIFLVVVAAVIYIGLWCQTCHRREQALKEVDSEIGTKTWSDKEWKQSNSNKVAFFQVKQKLEKVPPLMMKLGGRSCKILSTCTMSFSKKKCSEEKEHAKPSPKEGQIQRI